MQAEHGARVPPEPARGRDDDDRPAEQPRDGAAGRPRVAAPPEHADADDVEAGADDRHEQEQQVRAPVERQRRERRRRAGRCSRSSLVDGGRHEVLRRRDAAHDQPDREQRGRGQDREARAAARRRGAASPSVGLAAGVAAARAARSARAAARSTNRDDEQPRGRRAEERRAPQLEQRDARPPTPRRRPTRSRASRHTRCSETAPGQRTAGRAGVARPRAARPARVAPGCRRCPRRCRSRGSGRRAPAVTTTGGSTATSATREQRGDAPARCARGTRRPRSPPRARRRRARRVGSYEHGEQVARPRPGTSRRESGWPPASAASTEDRARRRPTAQTAADRTTGRASEK